MEEEILQIFTDESGINESFRALCAISGKKGEINKLNKELNTILKNHNIKELKFHEVRTHKPKIECSKCFIKTAIDFASRREIRIDTLIWDINDARHRICARDDKENLERMYYHLLRHILRQWNIYKIQFYPDEHTEYDYQKISYYLEATKNLKKNDFKMPLLIEQLKVDKINIEIVELRPMNSLNCTLIQLADIFGGFCRFSREKFKQYKNYKITVKNNDQFSLFPSKQDTNENSQAQMNRFEIISLIANTCKQNNITISIDTEGFLKSYDPSLPVNFWHYESQGDYDRAPTKSN